MEPTVEEALDMEPTVEEENINRTINEDVGLPPSNYQEESEGQQVATETPERMVDALDDCAERRSTAQYGGDLVT